MDGFQKEVKLQLERLCLLLSCSKHDAEQLMQASFSGLGRLSERQIVYSLSATAAAYELLVPEFFQQDW